MRAAYFKSSASLKAWARSTPHSPALYIGCVPLPHPGGTIAHTAQVRYTTSTLWRHAPTARHEREKMSDSQQTRILLATDGSKASFHAAERAVHLAGHLG